MKKTDLLFDFPESLIAQEPIRPSRICSAVDVNALELKWDQFLELFNPGDLLVLNDTKVLKRRVFTSHGLEILFLTSSDKVHWHVLFPSRRLKIGEKINLPNEVELTLLEKGRPQKVKTSQPLEESYFENFGELPLPPYIQKVRDDRHTKLADGSWYQTAWNQRPGSFAAPTASLHFTQDHLTQLRRRGVRIQFLTLHVGLGTFLPVEVEDLREHIMHEEQVEIPVQTLNEIKDVQKEGRKIFAMGTTVARALESYYLDKFQLEKDCVRGSTDLLILPGFKFQVVDFLLTNFHQPESTLLALVMAFAGVEKVKSVYKWAIEHKFRLFSYGDLSIWKRA